MPQKTKKVGVFVYGDIGRSPRMQNHAEELSKQYEVYLMGYVDSSPRVSIQQNQNIKLVDLQIHGLQTIRQKSFYVYALVRVVLQMAQILYVLGCKYRNLEFVLVQTPPSIPNLLGIWLASFLGWFRIYIDFHNYGFTILGLKFKNRCVLWLAKKYEQVLGRRCHRAFCVSNAMKRDLKDNWGIQAITLYDKPRADFCTRQLSKSETNSFFEKYNLEAPKEDELLVVSSTSWTKDEDFGVFLNAFQIYERSDSPKKLRAFITGKGPQKQYYVREIAKLKQGWKKVSIETVWLEADDYPTLLSLCDFGVCLHYSSSGVDLPMKIVDMFGAGIPVLAIDYYCLSELIEDGRNGYIFADEKSLFMKLQYLSDEKQGRQRLHKLKEGALNEQKHTWELQWRQKFPTK